MGYREKFFEANPSPTGQWCCARCGGWFPKDQIDVDHKIAKRLGGTDDLYNLQAMCKHCNRSKNKNTNNMDLASAVIGMTITGSLGQAAELGKSIAVQKLKDVLGLKYERK